MTVVHGRLSSTLPARWSERKQKQKNSWPRGLSATRADASILFPDGRGTTPRCHARYNARCIHPESGGGRVSCRETRRRTVPYWGSHTLWGHLLHGPRARRSSRGTPGCLFCFSLWTFSHRHRGPRPLPLGISCADLPIETWSAGVGIYGQDEGELLATSKSTVIDPRSACLGLA